MGAIQFLSAILTWNLSSLVFIFIINKLYIKDSVSEGYVARSVTNGNLANVSRAIGFPVPALAN